MTPFSVYEERRRVAEHEYDVARNSLYALGPYSRTKLVMEKILDLRLILSVYLEGPEKDAAMASLNTLAGPLIPALALYEAATAEAEAKENEPLSDEWLEHPEDPDFVWQPSTGKFRKRNEGVEAAL